MLPAQQEQDIATTLTSCAAKILPIGKLGIWATWDLFYLGVEAMSNSLQGCITAVGAIADSKGIAASGGAQLRHHGYHQC